MKKPDRFERLVIKEALGRGENRFLYADKVVTLLRREHAWMRKMVCSEQKKHLPHMDEWCVLSKILKNIDKRKR